MLTIPGASQPSLSRASLQNTRPTAPFASGAKPKIKGSVKVGNRIKASAGVFRPAPKKAIKGAKKPTYKITRKDRGHKLRVRVTATRSGYHTKTVISRPVRVKR